MPNMFYHCSKFFFVVDIFENKSDFSFSIIYLDTQISQRVFN